jgi:hypothetical protein
MIQNWRLMQASWFVFKKPLNEPQTEVLVAKESNKAQRPDLRIGCARIG